MARDPLLGQSASEPNKAYLIKWAIVNEMEALVYADSAADALRRFEDGEGQVENTSNDWRLRQPKAKRWSREDLDA